MRTAWVAAIAGVVLWGGCGRGGSAAEQERAALLDSSAGGTTQWVRRLGGLGDESVVALATGSDGSTTLLTRIGSPGSSTSQPDALGLVRLDRAGAVLWSTELSNSQGAAFEHLAIAVTALGNVYVVGQIECGLGGGGCSFDAGGGAVSGSMLFKFQPPGVFAWQRSLGGALSSNVAVDGRGGPLVAFRDAAGEHVRKYQGDGTLLWERPSPLPQGYAGLTAIAFDGDANVAVGGGLAFGKLDPAGDVLWTTSLAGSESATGDVASIGTTAIGTVVTVLSFFGTVSYAGTRSTAGAGMGAFIATAESDGSPRFGRVFGFDIGIVGAAVDPAGRLAILTRTGGCQDDVWKWNLAGELVWRRSLMTVCGDSGAALGTSIATDASSHDILVGGAMWGTVDFGNGPVTSHGGVDDFVVDILP